MSRGSGLCGSAVEYAPREDVSLKSEDGMPDHGRM
jgi:hypothetical protein